MISPGDAFRNHLFWTYGRRSRQPLAGFSDNAEVDVAPSFDAALEESRLFLNVIGSLQRDDINPAGRISNIVLFGEQPGVELAAMPTASSWFAGFE
jgi:hypothetical protein